MSGTIDSITSTPTSDVALPEASIFSNYGTSTVSREEITVAPIKRVSPSKPKSPKTRVLRRFKGFVVSLGDDEYRVAFVENGEYHLYDFPATDLKRQGISKENQPFEMDEISVDVEPYNGLIGYEFRPLAKANEGFMESLPIDDERQRKLNLIKAKLT